MRSSAVAHVKILDSFELNARADFRKGFFSNWLPRVFYVDRAFNPPCACEFQGSKRGIADLEANPADIDSTVPTLAQQRVQRILKGWRCLGRSRNNLFVGTRASLSSILSCHLGHQPSR